MNIYICYCSKVPGGVEIDAETLLAARDAAVAVFAKKAPRKKIKPGDVSANLASVKDKPITLPPMF
jgi:hypothetical protein